MGPDGLDLDTTDEQVNQIHTGPKPHDLTSAGWPQPELLPGQLHVARRRHHPVELDRATHPTLDGRLTGFCVGCPVLISVFG